MIVTVVDTTGIQAFVFLSNRLQENIGASYLVKMATSDWAEEALNANGGKMIYSGGGNFVCYFESEDVDSTNKFISQLSRKVLTNAPGLKLVFGSHESETLYDAVRGAFNKLAQNKQCRPFSSPLLGLSVTRSCVSTGLVANTSRSLAPAEPQHPVSAEVDTKLRYAKRANDELSESFREILDENNYVFPRYLDDLGRSVNEDSHLAVVHADGNDMGKYIAGFGNDPDNYEQAMKDFSINIHKASHAALCDVLNLLIFNLKGKNELVLKDSKGIIRSCLKLREAKSDKAAEPAFYLPFRPIVFGGDDVTFVCDARIGLPLAIKYLKSFETRAKEFLGTAFTACAGIAIVKTHHPFSSAYELSESLAASAKEYRRTNDIPGACLDWHLDMSGVGTGLQRIRSREYQVIDGSLTQRPLTLDANHSNQARSWQLVENALKEFQGTWSTKHNKLKQLRNVLRDGPANVEKFTHAHGELPSLGLGGMECKKGWDGKTCTYYDAIELEDRFIFLHDPDVDGQQKDIGIQGELR